MKRGPRPTPTRLKLPLGNPGKRPLNTREPQPRLGIPSCPKHLNELARKEWRRITRELNAVGLITNLDRGTLGIIYCPSLARSAWTLYRLRTSRSCAMTYAEAATRRRQSTASCRLLAPSFGSRSSMGNALRTQLTELNRAPKAAQELKPGDEGGDDLVSPDGVLSPAEVRRLLEAAQPGFDRTLFLTAFVSGAREGELFAVRWTDLELPASGPGRMYIKRSLSWAHLKGEPGRPRFFRPKTPAGLRVIAIPSELAAALKRWKLQCPPSPDELVFPREDGKPMYRERMLRKGFYPALARARLRRVTFHSLRHSCASAMIAAGAPVTEVQHHLGHANPAITLAVYSHWFKNVDSGGTVDRLAAAVLGVPSAPASQKPAEWAESGHSDERDFDAEVARA